MPPPTRCGPGRMPCGACSPSPTVSWGCSVTCAGSTCSSSPAVRPTSRPGWRARVPTRWRSTSPASSSPPPGGCSARWDRCSRWRSATASGCPWPTAASTSWSASTAPRRGATRSGGCPRRLGCSGPVAGWSSSPTATSRPCACRPTRVSPRSACCAATGRPTACSGPAAASSSTPRTATGCGCCAAAGFVVEALHEVFAPVEGTDHPFYEIVSSHWAGRWPAEELWEARRA